MSFQIERRNCGIHGGAHMHVRACTRCMSPLVDGQCTSNPQHRDAKAGALGTWGETERWKCVEALANGR